MWGYLPSYSAPPRTFLVLFALLFGIAGVVFARTPTPIPEDLANQMETSTAKLVFGLLYDRRDNKENVDAFGLVANKVATYFEMGSVIETSPDLLLSELIIHCDTPERPSPGRRGRENLVFPRLSHSHVSHKSFSEGNSIAILVISV
jgi:hypothetical protein